VNVAIDLEQAKAKYRSAIEVGTKRGVSWKNFHIENGKFLMRGAAPNEEIKNAVWSAIKAVDPSYADLTADLTVDPSLPVPQQAAAQGAAAGRTYEVKSGDSLSKIAKQFYGDAGQYPKIFEANRDQLSDPDKIQPGQKLKIP
jgi:nucleoid-associated protein YgaU